MLCCVLTLTACRQRKQALELDIAIVSFSVLPSKLVWQPSPYWRLTNVHLTPKPALNSLSLPRWKVLWLFAVYSRNFRFHCFHTLIYSSCWFRQVPPPGNDYLYSKPEGQMGPSRPLGWETGGRERKAENQTRSSRDLMHADLWHHGTEIWQIMV